MGKLFGSLLLMLLGFCTPAQALDITRSHNLSEPKIQYLGVGGWLLHWQGEGLLIAPSFSNPALFDREGWPPLRVAANTQRIDKYMPKADDVTVLLVGHGHYDHLLDVPWVMHKHTPKATLYGSHTVMHILKSMKDKDGGTVALDPARLVDVEDSMAKLPGDGQPPTPGKWFESSAKHIRMMPIQNAHAGHIFGINLIQGTYDAPLDEPPSTIFGWRPGQPMAWLIDLMEGERVVYRIHYQDSTAQPPNGLPPTLPSPDDKAVDVEILCVASWEQVDDYPQRLLATTHPRMVVLGHWENFFGNDPANPQPLIGQDVEGMVQAVKQALGPGVPVYLPAPLAEMALPSAR
ncbi:MAG: hypothetical protein LBJ33_23215 [Pseudomonas putida]|jgi:hypothetical protein|nr:hypothetical protein [Pseudomonas putida]